MSDVKFPCIQGLNWGCVMRPTFNTIKKKAASGKMTRAALWPEAIWEFDLTYEFVFDDPDRIDEEISPYTDLDQIVWFFLDRNGGFDNFLYREPKFNCVEGLQLAVSDGTLTTVQAQREIAGHLETIQAVDGIPTITGAAGPIAVTGVSNTGLITLATPAPAGPVLGSFNYLFRVCFKDDLHEYETFYENLYQLKKVSLIGDPL